MPAPLRPFTHLAGGAATGTTQRALWSVVPPQPTALQASVLCADDLPLALLPVRLETRFMAPSGNGRLLKIRIFPDALHLDAHDPRLSSEERAWGEHYWQQLWQSGDDAQARERAWTQLSDRFGATRASWIARALRPTNLAHRPQRTVAVRAGPAVQPQWPVDMPQRAAAPSGADWRQTARARLLPQRWYAIGLRQGAIVAEAMGTPVDQSLAVGPNPEAEATGSDVEPGLRWMTDFGAAEQCGMALTLAVPAAPGADARLDALLVFGVAALDVGQGALKPGERVGDRAAGLLAALLDAHRHTDGLRLLAPGSPTNQTEPSLDDGQSNDAAAGTASSLQVPGDSAMTWLDQAALGAGTDSAALAAALGLPADQAGKTLGTLPGQQRSDLAASQAMAAALWPATWGHYLPNMVAPGTPGLDAAAMEWARQWFIQHVRPFGPLPSLQIGRQTFGVLPVTSLQRWQPAGGDARQQKAVHGLLQQLSRWWRQRLPDVPRIGRSVDPAVDLADILQTDGISCGWRLRHCFGPEYLAALAHFFSSNPNAVPAWKAAQTSSAEPAYQALGVSWRAWVSQCAYAPAALTVTAPIVQGRAPAQTAATGIAALLDGPPLPPTKAGPAESTLLQLLLRHGLQREFIAAAARLGRANGGVAPNDAELHGFDSRSPLTWSQLLARNFVEGSPRPKLPEDLPEGELPLPPPKLAQAVLERLATPGDEDAQLLAHRQALQALKAVEPGTLGQLLAGTLDTCSHRLDAWLSAFANRRLAEMRAARSTGLRVGGYGLVLDLAPDPTPPQSPADPVRTERDDPGFLHAPSLAQVRMGVLLRNAHLTQAAGGKGEASDVGAVNLNSRRVRLAQWLLDGVRQGQPLGALLGYRVERCLHANGASALVQAARDLAPMQVPPLDRTEAALPTGPLQPVVDGVHLHGLLQAHRSNRTGPSEEAVALFQNPSAASALQELEDAADAVSDSLVAEAAFQAVNGRTAGLAATLQSLTDGTRPPPELSFAQTPRSGVQLVHRVVVLLPATLRPPAGWPTAAKSPRSAAEPRLAAWVGRLLGEPGRFRVRAQQLLPGNGDARMVELSLADLGIGPLDALALAAAPHPSGTELDALALHVAEASGLTPVAGQALELLTDRDPAWPMDLLSWQDLHALLKRAGGALARLRAVDARDLTLIRGNPEPGLDATELEARAKKAETALDTAVKALRKLIAAKRSKPADWFRALRALQACGQPGATPSGASGLPADAHVGRLASQAVQLLALAEQRRAQQLAATEPGAPPERRCALALDRLRAIFGDRFQALPLSRPTAAAHATLRAALGRSVALQGGDPLAAHRWVQRMVRVREPLAQLAASLDAAQALGAPEQARWQVAQLPADALPTWAALPTSAPVPGGLLSLVVQMPGSLGASAAPLAGFVADEWVETLPSAVETTGVAFRFDAPGARAPQSVLLAVPPVPTVGAGSWTVAGLAQLLTETVELAQLRAVDSEALQTHGHAPRANAPSALTDIAHHLPAVFLAVNAEGDALSPDAVALTR